jgi:hypothetical protein
MARYIIQSTHTEADCVRALDAYLQAGAHYLTNTDWGCKSGDHTGWTIIEADSYEEARLMVPPIARRDAKLVPLNKFSPDQVLDLHTRVAAQPEPVA